MQKYEIMIIFANSEKEGEVEKNFQKIILEKIKNSGGKILFEDFWGPRGFAYKIDGEKWGFYFVAQFELAAEKILELRHEWNLEKKIVRFLITKVHKNAGAPKKYSELQKEKKEENKKIETEKKEILEKKEEKNSEKSENEKSEKKDAVDKKLDAILENSSLDL